MGVKYALTVVIPTYNRCELLKFSLHSINRQSADPRSFEVIVVDDGSSDATRSAVEEFPAKFALRYLYQADLGYRVASARNLGITESAGEIVLFLDSGVLLATDAIEKHLKAHGESGTASVILGYVLGTHNEFSTDEGLPDVTGFIDPDDVDGSVVKLRRDLGLEDVREPIFSTCKDDLMRLPAPWAIFWTQNVSVAKAALTAAGLFDRNFDLRWGVEDLELGYRLIKNGIRYRLSREAISIHYPHFSDTEAKLEQERQNKKYFHAKFPCRETELLLQTNVFTLNEWLIKSESDDKVKHGFSDVVAPA